MRWLFDPLARFRGRLEGVSDQRLHGWAFDRRVPEVRQTVCLTKPDGHQVDVVADLYRADLHRDGIGDGHHGFSIPVAHLAGAKLVHATIKGSERPLIGSPFSHAGDSSGRPSVRNGLLFQVDGGTHRNLLTGWVIDLTETPRRPSVGLRHRDRVVARDRATRFRDDIDIPGCDALHGFRLTWTGLPPARCDLIDTRGDRVLATVRVGR